MGAALTTQNAKSNLELRKQIDYIAKNFIFDSDFTDMTKLGNEKYCNRLVKKVSDVFKNNKDSIDIVLLRKKLYEIKKNNNQQTDLDFSKEYDVPAPAPVDAPAPAPDAPAAVYDTYENEKRQQEQTTGGEGNVKTSRRKSTNRGSPTNKERQRATLPNVQNIKKKCNEIAKFYVLFAHLFSCIVSTINPSFEISSSSPDKSKTGANSLDFCSSRLNSLINDGLIQNSDGDVTIQPNVCKTNTSESGTALRLVDLPGIKALLKLFKDGGDDYIEDVKYLYKEFTGKDAPDDINIENIPLKVYNKNVECNGSSGTSSRNESRGGRPRYPDPNYYEDERYRNEERDFRNTNADVRSGAYLTGVTGNPTKEKLFSDYIKNIKLMIQKSENNRSLLLEILAEMFTYIYDSDGEISGVIINPSLTFKDLQSLVKRTRKIIIKLYTECEEDYNAGLDIFFALIQEKIMFKLTMQDAALRNELEKTIYGQQERYIINQYNQNPFIQQNQNANISPVNNPFVPPHFKQLVVKEFKKILKESEFSSDDNLSTLFNDNKDGLEEYIAEEIASANGPSMLDAAEVAKAYFSMYSKYDDDADDDADADADADDADDADNIVSSIRPKKRPVISPAAAPLAVAAPPLAVAVAPLAVAAPAVAPLAVAPLAVAAAVAAFTGSPHKKKIAHPPPSPSPPSPSPKKKGKP